MPLPSQLALIETFEFIDAQLNLNPVRKQNSYADLLKKAKGHRSQETRPSETRGTL